jgi:hypothetical protein
MTRGTEVGRKSRDVGESIDELVRRYRAGETIDRIAAATGLHRATVLAGSSGWGSSSDRSARRDSPSSTAGSSDTD